jgi:hypothetical protein
MKASLVALLVFATNAACSAENCDDFGCSSRLELTAKFEVDGEWSLSLGNHGTCDVTVVSGRVDSFSCSGAVTFADKPDANVFLIDGAPEKLAITYSGAKDGSATVSPRYEDQKPDCSSECLFGESQVDLG